MESYLPVFMFALSVAFVVTQFVMLFLISKSIKEHKKDHLGDERMNNDLKARTETIIQNAQSKANDILADAEKKGVAILASEETTGKQLSQDYSTKLAQIEADFKAELTQNALASVKKLDDLLTQAGHAMNEHISQSDKLFDDKTISLRTQIDAVIAKFAQNTQANTKLMEEKSSQMMDETRQLFEKIARQSREDIKKQLEGELTNAKAEIEQYKQSRLATINERIIDMLTDVITITLSKKLTLADQTDLVYQALEEAKKEHAFGGEKHTDLTDKNTDITDQTKNNTETTDKKNTDRTDKINGVKADITETTVENS
jgi:hypothetical protein